jgi:hypothetical protein
MDGKTFMPWCGGGRYVDRIASRRSWMSLIELRCLDQFAVMTAQPLAFSLRCQP